MAAVAGAVFEQVTSVLRQSVGTIADQLEDRLRKYRPWFIALYVMIGVILVISFFLALQVHDIRRKLDSM